jgi:hypothetical protein
MKSLLWCLALAFILTGCGGGGENAAGNNAAGNNAATPAPTRDAQVTPTPQPSTTPSPSTSAGDAERPVEFTYLGLTKDKQAIAYKIKVNAAKPISQVDLRVKYMDDAGKVLEETTIAWQNVVKSKRLPIEQGKTYEAEGYLPEGATKAEVKLARAIYTDGTRWEVN